MEEQELTWHRSSRSSATGACVEVAFDGDTVLVRDSKDREGPVLRFTKTEWEAFKDGVIKGEF